MDLTEYVKQRKGAAARLAETLGIAPVLISQWVKGEEDRLLSRTREGFEAGLCDKPEGRQVPEDRAAAIEWATGFLVRVETLCPDTRWQRVIHPAWPHGKPLIDKTPQPGPARSSSGLAKPQPESA